MAYDLQEQEQLAELKAWWAKYGTLLLAGLLVVAVGFAGWRTYEGWRGKQATAASALYEAAQDALATNQDDKFKAALQAAGLTAAVTAAKHGKKVIILEKDAVYGGTTAFSGGMIWIPGNRYSVEMNQKADA